MKISKEFYSQTASTESLTSLKTIPPKVFQSGFEERAWLTNHGKD